MIDHKFRMEGIITLRRIAADGSVTEEKTFKNLITDGGIGKIVQSNDPVVNLCMYCLVGTGNSVPVVTDVSLQNTRAYQIRDNTKMTHQQQYDVPAWGQATLGYRFPAGAATGNLSEIGFSNTSAPGSTSPIFSRALIRDTAGNPTTITVLATEALDVTYQVRMYWPEDKDLTGTFVIEGVTYSYVGKIMRVVSNVDVQGGAVMGNNWLSTAGNGDTGWVWSAITTPATSTSDPVGTRHPNARWGNFSVTPYVAGVNERTKSWSTNAGTIQTGVIAACEFKWFSGAPRIVLQFTPPIPIDVTQSFTVSSTASIGR